MSFIPFFFDLWLFFFLFSFFFMADTKGATLNGLLTLYRLEVKLGSHHGRRVAIEEENYPPGIYLDVPCHEVEQSTAAYIYICAKTSALRNHPRHLKIFVCQSRCTVVNMGALNKIKREKIHLSLNHRCAVGRGGVDAGGFSVMGEEVPHGCPCSVLNTPKELTSLRLRDVELNKF
jgi:hypothetical protein